MTLTLNPEAIDLATLRQLWLPARSCWVGLGQRQRCGPATGVRRHADAGYEEAIACARERGLDLPMIP